MTREPAFAVVTRTPSVGSAESAQISEGGPFANGRSCGRSIVGAAAIPLMPECDETRYDALGAAGARPTTNAVALQHVLRQLHCDAESFDEWGDASSWPEWLAIGIGISAEPWWWPAIAALE